MWKDSMDVRIFTMKDIWFVSNKNKKMVYTWVPPQDLADFINTHPKCHPADKPSKYWLTHKRIYVV